MPQGATHTPMRKHSHTQRLETFSLPGKRCKEKNSSSLTQFLLETSDQEDKTRNSTCRGQGGLPEGGENANNFEDGVGAS